MQRFLKWRLILVCVCIGWLGLMFSSVAQGVEFTCDEAVGGKISCLLERGENLTRLTCKQGTLIEIKWVCSFYPEKEKALCRSRDGGQRLFNVTEFEDDSNLCTSMCYCPEKK